MVCLGMSMQIFLFFPHLNDIVMNALAYISIGLTMHAEKYVKYESTKTVSNFLLI